MDEAAFLRFYGKAVFFEEFAFDKRVTRPLKLKLKSQKQGKSPCCVFFENCPWTYGLDVFQI